MKFRIFLSLAMLISLLSGCLPTYVGDPEKSVIDDHLLGVWLFKGSPDQLWFMHRLDSHSYLVQTYSFERKDGTVTLKGQPITLRAWITPLAGKNFISMQMFDPRHITDPTGEPAKNRYLVAAYELKGDTITVQGISDHFVKDNHITTPAEFEKALTEHGAEDGTFVDPNAYDRVDVKNPGAAADLMDAVEKAAEIAF